MKTLNAPLPAWAKFSENQIEGKIPRIEVDAEAMYEAFLQEFAENPPPEVDRDSLKRNLQREIASKDGKPTKAQEAALAAFDRGDVPDGIPHFPDFPGRLAQDPKKGEKVQIKPMLKGEEVCNPEAPTQYWLECAYQCMKMELQVAMRTFSFEIRIQDHAKKYALKNWPPGRGTLAAAQGLEARGHFKRLRGFIP